MFSYPCPSCSQRLQAAPERVGQRTICPKCLSPIVIPRAEGAVAVEEHIHMPAMSVDSPSTIFVDDFATDDEADGMDLSLPDDAEEFTVFGNDSAPYPEMDTPQAQPMSDPVPVAESRHVGSFTAPAMSLAAAGVVPSTAVPNLSGLAAPPMDHTPLPSRMPPPRTRENGVVVFQSTPMESLNIAAELTTALTMRMKPPPEPPSDLRLSTGAWLALNAAGLSLWMLSMMRAEDDQARQLLSGVGALGILQVIISYIWVAYLGGRKSLRRGLEALLPPVWLYRLAIPESNSVGHRPLRFLMTGLLLLALSIFGGQMRPRMHALFGEPEMQQVEVPAPQHPTLTRLRDAKLNTSTAPLLLVLAELSKPWARENLPEDEKPKLLAELNELCGDPTEKPPRPGSDDSEVRAAALTALFWFTPDHQQLKPRIIAYLINPGTNSRVRKAAIQLAPMIKDLDIARALISCLSLSKLIEAENVMEAKDALRGIGAPEAETALLEQLNAKNMVFSDFPNLLADFGGERSAKKLTELAEEPEIGESTRRTLLEAVEKINKRLGTTRKPQKK